jgi:hypothetical protein
MVNDPRICRYIEKGICIHSGLITVDPGSSPKELGVNWYTRVLDQLVSYVEETNTYCGIVTSHMLQVSDCRFVLSYASFIL